MSAAGGAGRLRSASLVLLWAGAAAAVGAVGAAGAYYVHPLLVPGALALAGLAAVSFSRIEVGIAAWFVLVVLGVQGALGEPPWLVPTGWAVLLLGLVLAGGASDAAPHTLPPLAGVVLAFTVVTVAQSLRTDDPADALPVIRSAVTGTIMFLVIAAGVRTARQALWAVGGVAAAATLVALVAVYQSQVGETASGFITGSGELVSRVGGGFAQANSLGGFLLLLTPIIAAGALLAPRLRAAFGLAAVLAVVGVYLSFSRGALLGLAIAPLVFVGARRALLVAPVVALLVVAVAPDVLRERFTTATAQGSELASRLDFWRTAIDLWVERPLLGVGPGDFAAEYASARLPGKQFLPTTMFEPPPHAHNLPLNLLAEQGLVGLGLFLAVVTVAFLLLAQARRAPEAWRRRLAAGLAAGYAGFLVHNVFDVTLVEDTGTYAIALLGLVSAVAVPADGRPQVPRGRRRTREG